MGMVAGQPGGTAHRIVGIRRPPRGLRRPEWAHECVGYDPAVFFKRVRRLAVGELPYRDLRCVHPPGIAVLLAPFSLLANATNDVVAFASARLVFITLGAIGAILIYVVARRLGTVTAIVAGLTSCIAPGLVYTERTTYLEVFMVLATLVGLLLFNRAHPSKIHLVLGGALFGLAVSTKLWALVPLLVIAIGLVVLKSWRQAALYLGSAAAFGVLLMGPFFLAAPQQMYQMIVVDQLGRPPLPGHGLPRLGMVFGIDEKLEPTNPALCSGRTSDPPAGGLALSLDPRARHPNLGCPVCLSGRRSASGTDIFLCLQGLLRGWYRAGTGRHRAVSLGLRRRPTREVPSSRSSHHYAATPGIGGFLAIRRH